MSTTGKALGGVQSRTDHLGEGETTTLVALRRAVVRRAPLLREGYQALRSPALQLDLWRDQASWHRSLQELRNLPEPTADAPVALAVSTSDKPFDVKSRIVATIGLRQRGWRVVVLARNRRSSRLHRLYRSAGIDDFVYLDEVELTPAERADVQQAVRSWSEQPVWRFGDVRQWTYGDSWIGPQVLSSVSRRLLEGAPDPTDPVVRKDIETLLPQVVHVAARAQALLRSVDPRLAVLDEYNYTLAGPLTDVLTARGRALVTMRPMFDDQALLPMRLTAASRRFHHATVTRPTLEDLAHGEWTAEHEAFLEAEFSRRYEVRAQLTAQRDPGADDPVQESLTRTMGLRQGRPLAVIFSHVLWDANLFYGEDLFDNFGHWLAETVRAAAANDQVDWIVKLHPANLSKAKFHGSQRLNELEIIDREIGDLPDHVHVMLPDAPVNTLDLYTRADVGVTVRGTVGLEMPCFGRPVLTAGTGRYDGLGFTLDSDTREEYLHRLATLQDQGRLDHAQTALAKWHAYALFQLREWRLKSFAIERRPAAPGRHHPLEINLVRARRGSLAEADDLQTLTRWMADEDGVDFVAHDPLGQGAHAS